MGVGMFILYQHVDRAAIQLSRLLGMPYGTLGALPTAIFATSRCLQASATDHRALLQYFVVQTLVSCWPLVLVTVGTVMSRDGVAGEANRFPKKTGEGVDLADRGSTLK